MFIVSSDILNKNTWDVKIVRGQVAPTTEALISIKV